MAAATIEICPKKPKLALCPCRKRNRMKKITKSRYRSHIYRHFTPNRNPHQASKSKTPRKSSKAVEARWISSSFMHVTWRRREKLRRSEAAKKMMTSHGTFKIKSTWFGPNLTKQMTNRKRSCKVNWTRSCRWRSCAHSPSLARMLAYYATS